MDSNEWFAWGILLLLRNCRSIDDSDSRQLEVHVLPTTCNLLFTNRTIMLIVAA